MKIVSILLAAVAALSVTGAALANHEDHFPVRDDGYVYYAAEHVYQEADLLTQILRRENADYRLVYNSGLVLFHAQELLEGSAYSVYDVVQAYQTLLDQWRYARVPPSYYAQAQLRRLSVAVRNLETAAYYGNGGGGDVVIVGPRQ